MPKGENLDEFHSKTFFLQHEASVSTAGSSLGIQQLRSLPQEPKYSGTSQKYLKSYEWTVELLQLQSVFDFVMI